MIVIILAMIYSYGDQQILSSCKTGKKSKERDLVKNTTSPLSFGFKEAGLKD